MRILSLFASTLAILSFGACSPMESRVLATSQNSPQQTLGEFLPGEETGPGGRTGGNPAMVEAWKGLSICSNLDFKGLIWSPSVPFTERNPFALALNISGSYEGHLGWANLTNNFDGQGVSMGLLNQNLGQGSLQPMWLEMRNANLPVLQTLFSAANLKSMSGMLTTWESTVNSATINVNDYGYSELDDPNMIAMDLGLDPLELQEVNSALLARNQTSVNWAKSNLYNGSDFKSDWSKSLTALANSATYRSIQVRKAEKLHNAAIEMMDSLGFSQVNAYLFFFDIAVQNGGISLTARSEYKTWAAKNAKSTEEVRLTKLLEIRLRSVIAAYVADVRSRKTAIINGTGTVHGAKRDFEKEYCSKLKTKF